MIRAQEGCYETPVTNAEWLEKDQQNIMATVPRYPLAVAHAEGHTITDIEGKHYLDLVAGLGVNLLGYRHPRMLAALQEQAERFLHISNLMLNIPAITFAERLAHLVFGPFEQEGKAFFTNSGAETTETALKIIYRTQKEAETAEAPYHFVTLRADFHGRTFGALCLAPHLAHPCYPQLPFRTHQIVPEDLTQAAEVFAAVRPKAVFFEPILGAGGVIPLSAAYMQGLAKLAREHDALLVIDEIQTGFGRTGPLFAHQYAGIQPDLLLLGKGIGGGLPLGAVLARQPYADVMHWGDHGSTFAPNPPGAALGNALLDLLLEEGMLESVQIRSQVFKQGIEDVLRQSAHDQLLVRGRGFMLGIYGFASGQAHELQRMLLKAGFITNVTGKDVLRLLPPLTFTTEEGTRFSAALHSCLERLPVQTPAAGPAAT